MADVDDQIHADTVTALSGEIFQINKTVASFARLMLVRATDARTAACDATLAAARVTELSCYMMVRDACIEMNDVDEQWTRISGDDYAWTIYTNAITNLIYALDDRLRVLLPDDLIAKPGQQIDPQSI
jgi:hypothetical protein